MANKFGMFLIGGVVGAVAALLAAPRSGAETRAMVADKAGEFAGNAQQWGDSAAAGAQHIYQEAATKGAEVVNNVTARGQEIASEAAARGVKTIVGHYYPTAKNAMVREFYAQYDFAKTAEDADGNTEWTLDVAAYTPKHPHMKIER